jgi:L-lactate utilization protein LutB
MRSKTGRSCARARAVATRWCLAEYPEQPEQKVTEQAERYLGETARGDRFLLKLASKNIQKLVKSKSMVGEEIQLNEELECYASSRSKPISESS